jgi:hypothetical protein
VYRGVGCLRLRHVAHARRRAADGHARLQVVDEVCDEGDEKEEDKDDEEDDNVALHGGGMKGARGCRERLLVERMGGCDGGEGL